MASELLEGIFDLFSLHWKYSIQHGTASKQSHIGSNIFNDNSKAGQGLKQRLHQEAAEDAMQFEGTIVIHIHTVYISKCVYKYIYLCMYICIYVYMYVCMYICICQFVYMCLCVYQYPRARFRSCRQACGILSPCSPARHSGVP